MPQEAAIALGWSREGWEDYLYWQKHDRKMLKRINELVRDCLRHPFTGIGKPEPLRFHLKGGWSRRISQEHRLVYELRGEGETAVLIILQCRFHY